LRGSQTLDEPTEPLEMTLRIPHRARKPDHHYFIGGECIQAYHCKLITLPNYQGGYSNSQSVFGLLILAHNNGYPFGPIEIDKREAEPLFREPIHKPTDSTLLAYKSSVKI